jgi:acyl-CoA reductase-like NAD-dependent aldehyde dehydrogenase
MQKKLNLSFSKSSSQDADRAIEKLSDRKQIWITVDIPTRIEYLHRCIKSVIAVAEEWANAACLAKGIDPTSQLAGEEWMVGAVATLLNLRQLITSLQANGQPRPVNVGSRSNGQIVAQVFPDSLMDRLLWLGFKSEIWITPNQPATQGLIYHTPPANGTVSLVLGAGNISSIAPMDTLYKLFAKNQVVLLKMNPVNDYLGAILQQALQPLIADGFVQIVFGGADLGRYLCQHPKIETIHVTGSAQTHDAIVWGDSQTPLHKPITSELGCVTPILVVPGNWSPSDLAFQARHVAAMVVHNASFNCAAAQVLVTSEGWQQREAFLTQLKQELAKIPARQAYYPGTAERYRGFLDRYPQAEIVGEQAAHSVPWTVISKVPADGGEYALTTEAFCGILAEVQLEGAEAKSFLAEAVEFANTKIWGNLSCVVLVDALTQKKYAAELESAIANLHYGAIGLNVWTGVLYFLSPLTWGAFPGNPLDNIQSGRGVVHNTHLFDHPQKSVLRAPFRIRPTPSWFAGHKTLLPLAQALAKLQVNPSWSQFLRIVWLGLWG